ncbi:VOC family protein [Labrys sp. La1]|uniref:VOC family protein n=1 Tax=Labrys sp. La1 TaxID=3404917 RepID=UPI003EBAEE1A
MTVTHGDFVWYELMTTDVKGAAAFYAAVLGWEAADSGMPGPAYMLFSNKGALVAGLMDIPPDAAARNTPPNWSGFVAADDVDASAAEVTRLGGKIYRAPDDIPGIGRFAIAADPDGAVFGLFKGQGEAPEMPGLGTPGHIAWRELHAGDAAGALAFYSKLFGWEKREGLDMGPMGVYQLYGKKGTDYGGVMTRTEDMCGPIWVYYVQVEDIDETARRVAANGGTITLEPMEVPGEMWVIQARDPQGALTAMVGPRPRS